MDSKGMFKKTLTKFKILFGGELGKVDIQPGDLEVKEGTKPYATTYYNIPKMYEKPFRTGVDRMVTSTSSKDYSSTRIAHGHHRHFVK